jgi:predicted nucleotidyltransferase
MDVARPYSAVAPGIEGDVLVVLAGTTRQLTGREIARLARRGSPHGVNKALARLTAHGLVRQQSAGPAYLYTLNRKHVAAPAALALAGMRADLIGRLRDELSAWTPMPLHASMFGSTARGDGHLGSDIDLLIVRPHEADEGDPAWRDQVARLHDRVGAWTGNPVSIVELADSEVAYARKVIGLADDAIDLAGAPLRELMTAPAP